MTPTEKKAFVLRTWQSLVSGDMDAALANFAEDLRFVINGDLPGWQRVNVGLGFLRELSAGTPKLFPHGVAMTVGAVLCDGNTVILEYRLRAETANGRQYDNGYCVFFELRAGKIVEIREYNDTDHIVKTLFG